MPTPESFLSPPSLGALLISVPPTHRLRCGLHSGVASRLQSGRFRDSAAVLRLVLAGSKHEFT